MPSPQEAGPVTAEQLEQYVLGVLPQSVRAQLDDRLRTDAALREELDVVSAYCHALRGTLRAHAQDASVLDVPPPDDFTLAAYLDGALPAVDHAVLETRLANDPVQLPRLVALAREVVYVSDPTREIVLAERFAAGETVPFVKREQIATPEIPVSYAEVEAAVEERKRRYLQFGN